MSQNRLSKRFSIPRWQQVVIPVILALLALSLLVLLVFLLLVSVVPG